MKFLSESERETLRNICDTFTVGIDTAISPLATDETTHLLTIAERFESRVGKLGEQQTTQLKRLLKAFENPLTNLTMAGRFRRFSQCNAKDREALLLAWGTSIWPIARSGFMTLKRLALFLAYTPPDGQRHSMWDSWNYSDPPTPSNNEPQLQTTQVGDDDSLTADVLIIGAGAGGSVVAAELAARGCDVLVVDKGPAAQDADLGAGEAAGMHRFYERMGSFTSDDQSTVVLAGSAMGGGTLVNWMTCLPPTEQVRRQWANEFGFTGSAQPEFDLSQQAVTERLQVSQPQTENRQNQLLKNGCEALGLTAHHLYRNAGNCTNCGFCGYGCSQGGKHDTRRTFLRDAQSAGARLIADARVTRVLTRNGVAAGAELQLPSASGVRTVTVKSKVVVAAAGAIQTPALLRRSGLANRHIGENLHLHPTTATFALNAEPVRSWEGVPQSRMCDDFSDLDGAGFGVRLETAPAHPGLWAASAPWDSATSHRRLMTRLTDLSNIIVLTRDRHSGRVLCNGDAPPKVRYRLRGADRKHLIQGAVESLRIHRAAGAEEVFSPGFPNLSFAGGSDSQFESFLNQVSRRGYRPNSVGLFSAHQLSSCRIAGSAKLGPVQPSGETWEIANLFVADGSTLPNASGVNPMISIMTVAHLISQSIAEKLQA